MGNVLWAIVCGIAAALLGWHVSEITGNMPLAVIVTILVAPIFYALGFVILEWWDD